jgi:MYXO-CTERM domain-containing protein
MKSTLHILSSLALAAVGASMASAQTASAYANGYVYGSWSGGDSYYSYAGQDFYANYAYGAASSYETRGYTTYLNGYGASTAGPGYGISYGESEYYFVTELYNGSNYTQAEYVTVDTSSVTSAYANVGQFAGGESYGWGYDTNGNYDQYSESESYVDNAFYGYNFAYAETYVNGYVYYAQGGPYYGFYPTGWGASAAFDNTYEVLLAPGQYDDLVFYSFDLHETESFTGASSGVPGPAAVAPFALGLLGAMRRRRKS